MNDELIRQIVRDMQDVMAASLKLETLTKKELTTDDHINLVMTILANFVGHVLININKNADFFNIHKAILILTNTLYKGLLEKNDEEL